MIRRELRYIITSLSTILIGLLIIGSGYISQDSNLIRSIVSKINNYYLWYPQQKAYLHIDKTRYSIEDQLWFKAYVVDASTNLPDEKSSNLFVELINPNGYMVQAKRIRLRNGSGNGEFAFQDTVPEGRYLIRAYTNWMRNKGEGFYFTKEIYVENPLFSNYATREMVARVKKAKRKTSKMSSDFDVSFHPEGGNLLRGVDNNIAFKAINDLGQSVEVKGEIINSKGEVLTEVNSIHAGMGSFRIKPEKGLKYFFIANSEGLKSRKFKLPEAKEFGINIMVEDINKDEFKLRLSSNLTKGNYPPNTKYALIAHTGGVVKFTGEIDLKDENPEIIISRSSFPTGLAHLTLFNFRESPISERLIFINHNDFPEISIISKNTTAGKREKLDMEVKLQNKEGKSLAGNFSLAVVKNDHLNYSDNILSNLLLNSELRGNIEYPAFYFTNMNDEKSKYLDLLMLTQGWRRFEWPELILNEKIKPVYDFHNGIEIGGKITRDFFGIPFKNIKVTLNILNEYNDVFLTHSDFRGRFLFDNLDYNDTMKVKIEAIKPNGKKNLVILVEDDITSELKDFDYITEQYLKKPGEEGRWNNQLYEEEKEFDPFERENNDFPSIHNKPSSSNIIIVDENLRNSQSVAQILQGRVPGVNVSGNSVTIRGPSTFYGNPYPLFLVDGMPIDMQSAMSMSPNDIERIEVLKGPEAAIYGSRAANGVIAIYTRRGMFMVRGELTFEMLGYSTPKEFYSPRYELYKDEEFEDTRTTLMWIPTINFDSAGKARFDFYTSDREGNYQVVVEGLTVDGKPGIASKKITIK